MHRHAKRSLGGLSAGIDGLKMAQQRRAGVPAHIVAMAHHGVAGAGANRDRRHRSKVHILGKLGKIISYFGENIVVIADKVHLVDRQHDVANAEQ